MSVNSPIQNVRAMTEWLQWLNKKYNRKQRIKKQEPKEAKNVDKSNKLDVQIEEYLYYKKR
jgi:cytochrome c